MTLAVVNAETRLIENAIVWDENSPPLLARSGIELIPMPEGMWIGDIVPPES